MRYEIANPNSSKLFFDSFFTDKLISDFMSTTGSSVSSWYPKVDVIEKDDKYFVKADLPGMTQKDIDIELVNGNLTIRGERKHEEKHDKDNYFRCERAVGQFTRSFAINDVDEKNIKADYSNGVLTIELPKAEEKKSRKILIS